MRLAPFAILILSLVGIAAADVQEIPTLDMQTSSDLSNGILDPWYAILAGLTSLIVLMIIYEIAKKMGVG